VTVQIGSTLLIDFDLQAGAVELAAVTVTGASAVELRTSEVAVNITPQQMQQLPTTSRNFLDLASLAPGVVATEDRVDANTRTFRSGGMGANSKRTRVAIDPVFGRDRSEEHTSELQSRSELVCRPLLEKKK